MNRCQTMNRRTRRALPLMALLLSAPAALAQGDSFQGPRQRALAHLVVAAPATVDADVQAAIAADHAKARAWWQSMNRDAARSELWSDLGALSRSARNTASMGRLRSMAIAYAQSGGGGPDGAPWLQDTVAALDWLVATHYSAGSSFSGNWWDWEIGTPQALNDCMLALYAELGPARRAAYIAAIDRWVPDPTRRTVQPGVVETGANRLDKALVVVLRGLLGADAAKVAAGRDAISQTLPFVSSGDGFYADGSFVQHHNVAYTGSYGAVMVASLSKLLTTLADSSWAVTDPQLANVDHWLREAFLPTLQAGAALDNLRGRAISRASDEAVQGRGLVRDLLRLSRRSSALDAPAFLSVLKAQVQQDQRRASYYSGLEPAAIAELKALMADPGLLATPLAPQSRVYAAMARGVHRRPGFVWSLASFSPRISAFEAGNGENLRGWYTGAGATTLLLPGDGAQYGDGYWATVDMARLPGVTSDGWLRTPGNFASYLNPNSWVGGAALPLWGQVQGLQFSYVNLKGSDGSSSPVSGRKSWFALGDTVIALGSDIRSSGAAAVETIAEQRRLRNSDGSDALMLDGSAQPTIPGSDSLWPGLRSAYLEQPEQALGIGYYFPALGATAQTVRVRRELRSGSWSAVNSGGPTALLTRPYLSLALHHGLQPGAARYAYVVLPGVSAAELAAYAAAPGLELLAHGSAAHAIWDGRSGMGGAAVWVDGVHTVARQGMPWLSTDRKSAVLLREDGGELSLAVSDPTQQASGALLLERFRPVAQLLSVDPAITVLSTTPTLRLSVKLDGLRGRAPMLRARLLPSAVLGAEADAYVRDGAHAGSNHGAQARLETKHDASGYFRRSFLRFALGGAPAAQRAQLRLSVAALGSGSTPIVNAVYGCASTWSESALNWSNQPTLGAELGRFSVAGAGSDVGVDLSAAVQAAQAAGQTQLCLALGAPSYQGAQGWLQFNAREAGAAGAPQLWIN